MADSVPEVVMASAGDGLAVAVSQELSGLGAVAFMGVGGEVAHQGGGDRLPAAGSVFLAEVGQALCGVEVVGA
nr:hypothetical protein [Nocardia anaemiae]